MSFVNSEMTRVSSRRLAAKLESDMLTELCTPTILSPPPLTVLNKDNMLVDKGGLGRAATEIIQKEQPPVPMPTDSLALMVQVQAALSGHPIQCQRVTQVIVAEVQGARKTRSQMTADQLLGVTIWLDGLDYLVRIVVDAWLTAAHIQVIDTRKISHGEQVYREITYEEFEAHKNAVRKSQGR